MDKIIELCKRFNLTNGKKECLLMFHPILLKFMLFLLPGLEYPAVVSLIKIKNE